MKNLFYLLLLILSGCGGYPDQYEISEIDLVPEGIAYSESQDAFYLTSVAKSKIIRIERSNGKQEDFISSGAYGYKPGVGIFADDERKLLYALGGYYRLADSVSSLFIFHLESGKLLRKYDVGGSEPHFLNDLIMDDKGTLYITDTKDASIYILPKDTDSLQLFYKSDEIKYPNGIAISDDNKKLYIASQIHGVRILDLNSRRLLNAPDTSGISQGIDGLEFYSGNLYAIQNGVKPQKHNFRKLLLNEDQSDITEVEIIDENNPQLNHPLTFCIANGQAFVIANSNLQYLDQSNYTFHAEHRTKPTEIVRYDLPWSPYVVISLRTRLNELL